MTETQLTTKVASLTVQAKSMAGTVQEETRTVLQSASNNAGMDL